MTEKIEFEILRDRYRRPTITVCTISANGSIGIGMSIRSLNDNPIERVGRAKAYGRAKKAMFRKKTTLPICRKEAFEAISTTCWNRTNWNKSIYYEIGEV